MTLLSSFISKVLRSAHNATSELQSVDVRAITSYFDNFLLSCGELVANIQTKCQPKCKKKSLHACIFTTFIMCISCLTRLFCSILGNLLTRHKTPHNVPEVCLLSSLSRDMQSVCLKS